MERNANPEIFHSKVMLFGEYSIILGSMGITIPYSHFNGELRFLNKNSYTDVDYAVLSNTQIRTLKTFITSLIEQEKLLCEFNINKLEEDLNNGLFFESSIPEGYGLGSSGALVAALYNAYAINPIEGRVDIKQNDLLTLKRIFAQIESFYHGTSSGLDPLICYLRQPVLIKKELTVHSTPIPQKEVLTDNAIFLIDSGKPGKTEPLVKLFMDKIKETTYHCRITDELIPLTNQCIEELLAGNITEMFNQLKRLSAFQLTYFNEMIPTNIQPLWQVGLDTSDYLLKLCGSGGGGYMLGFTRRFKQTKAFFKEKGYELIPVYKEV